MINRTAITQWNKIVPWNDNAQVEQDLIISRALVAIFSDKFLASQLAFRGGTALHKLYLSPQPRYSEDIDLVQITPGPIKPIMFKLGEVLSFLPDRVTKYGAQYKMWHEQKKCEPCKSPVRRGLKGIG